MREEAPADYPLEKQSGPRSATKPGRQAQNPDVLLARTRPTSACQCSSRSGLLQSLLAYHFIQLWMLFLMGGNEKKIF
jgi:hypothetical protein